MLPEGPVVSAEEHAVFTSSTLAADVSYQSEPRVDFPVLPLLPFGVAYDVDIVIVSKHPDWNMHEYARLATPQGPLWLAKDAAEPDLEQSIVAGIDGIDTWWPEIPVPRKTSDFVVNDRSTSDQLDLEIGYENMAGEPVFMTYRGPSPTKLQSKRNGSTMGHSRDQLLAVLDLSHRNFGREASMTINGERIPVKKLLGLVPFRMALQQVQGGLATGAFSLEFSAGGLRSQHYLQSGSSATLDWVMDETDSEVVVNQLSEIRSLRYFFRKTDSGLELFKLQSEQWGREEPTCVVYFEPALPDMRRQFSGVATSDFMIDINGQRGHATGQIEVRSDSAGAQLRVVPTDPWWVEDRPLESTITFQENDRVAVEIKRISFDE